MKSILRILTIFFLFCSFGLCDIVFVKFPSSLSDLGSFNGSCTQKLKDDIKNFYINYYNSFVVKKFNCSDNFGIFDAVNAKNDLENLIKDFNSKCPSIAWNIKIPSYDCFTDYELEEIAKKAKLENEKIQKEKNKEVGFKK